MCKQELFDIVESETGKILFSGYPASDAINEANWRMRAGLPDVSIIHHDGRRKEYVRYRYRRSKRRLVQLRGPMYC